MFVGVSRAIGVAMYDNTCANSADSHRGPCIESSTWNDVHLKDINVAEFFQSKSCLSIDVTSALGANVDAANKGLRHSTAGYQSQQFGWHSILKSPLPLGPNDTLEMLCLNHLHRPSHHILRDKLLECSRIQRAQDHAVLAICQVSGSGKTKAALDIGLQSTPDDPLFPILITFAASSNVSKDVSFLANLFDFVKTSSVRAGAQISNRLEAVNEYCLRLFRLFILSHLQFATLLWSHFKDLPIEQRMSGFVRAQIRGFEGLPSKFLCDEHTHAMSESQLDDFQCKLVSAARAAFIPYPEADAPLPATSNPHDCSAAPRFYFIYDEVASLQRLGHGIFLHTVSDRPIDPSVIPSTLETGGYCTSLFHGFRQVLDRLISGQTPLPQIMIDTHSMVWAVRPECRSRVVKFSDLGAISADGMASILHYFFRIDVSEVLSRRLALLEGRPYFFAHVLLGKLVSDLQAPSRQPHSVERLLALIETAIVDTFSECVAEMRSRCRSVHRNLCEAGGTRSDGLIQLYLQTREHNSELATVQDAFSLTHAGLTHLPQQAESNEDAADISLDLRREPIIMTALCQFMQGSNVSADALDALCASLRVDEEGSMLRRVLLWTLFALEGRSPCDLQPIDVSLPTWLRGYRFRRHPSAIAQRVERASLMTAITGSQNVFALPDDRAGPGLMCVLEKCDQKADGPDMVIMALHCEARAGQSFADAVRNTSPGRFYTNRSESMQHNSGQMEVQDDVADFFERKSPIQQRYLRVLFSLSGFTTKVTAQVDRHDQNHPNFPIMLLELPSIQRFSPDIHEALRRMRKGVKPVSCPANESDEYLRFVPAWKEEPSQLERTTTVKLTQKRKLVASVSRTTKKPKMRSSEGISDSASAGVMKHWLIGRPRGQAPSSARDYAVKRSKA